jgi:hypothetical protein
VSKGVDSCFSIVAGLKAEIPIGVTGHHPPLIGALRQSPVRVGRPEMGVTVGQPSPPLSPLRELDGKLRCPVFPYGPGRGMADAPNY